MSQVPQLGAQLAGKPLQCGSRGLWEPLAGHWAPRITGVRPQALTVGAGAPPSTYTAPSRLHTTISQAEGASVGQDVTTIAADPTWASCGSDTLQGCGSPQGRAHLEFCQNTSPGTSLIKKKDFFKLLFCF